MLKNITLPLLVALTLAAGAATAIAVASTNAGTTAASDDTNAEKVACVYYYVCNAYGCYYESLC